MKKMKLLLLCLVAGVMGAKAQMGYQISLLNTATGEPRANETVTVSVSLSNNANEVFYTETKSATTNDFGVLSLSIGNADTFKEVDLSKMPFFIEVTANGVMIGKSQMLSVPIAEVAKQVAPVDIDLLVGTWKGVSLYKDYCIIQYPEDHEYEYEYILKINNDRTFSYEEYGYSYINNSYVWKLERSFSGEIFEIAGNRLYLYMPDGNGVSSSPRIVFVNYWNGRIYNDGDQNSFIDYFEK
jgi:hypothetical protein